ncbi:MAG: HpcH/HpaI aldolase family protein [Solirubrobacteraceae bacterium]
MGTVLTLPGATAAELLAEPFDLVWVDLEHAALGPLEAQDMILGAQAAGAFALVRLPADAHTLMAAMLDAGADGVVLAGVTSVTMAAAAIDKTSHPPDGSRGWGPRRVTLRQRGTGRRPARPSVWVQIESADGVEAVTEILGVPGIAAAVVGTADLSFSLGKPLDSHAPELAAAIDAVRRACLEVGLPLGVAGALDRAPAAAYAGASILVHSTDARLCAGAVDGAAAWMRQTLESEPNGAAL